MLDIQSNRKSRKYTARELLLRILWGVGKRVFAWSPRTMFRFRVGVLRLFGARVGSRVHIYPSAIIYYPWNLTVGDESAIGEDVLIYNLGPVSIGSRATISHRAHLCAGSHDYRDPTLPLLKPPIAIGDQAWICADAFVGPNVSVGAGAIVGARAVVFANVPPWKIVVGNPARIIKDRHLNHPEMSPDPH
jgi:putative colanic acid biosynthesis acetyltransferase WcaF